LCTLAPNPKANKDLACSHFQHFTANDCLTQQNFVSFFYLEAQD